MEVGAVKQAFNNEVIQLKKNVNQAKIQTIHKLTRKAKTFAEKKAPDKLKEKLKRKAECAVNEVLIIKKIKPRDVARFTVTHTGNLQDYLNKPTVDQDKACARLLLHKSLQEKYKVIRTTFSGIPIKDLLMSRHERRKLKREALLDKKMKKDKKQKVVNAVGEWDVETVKTDKFKDVSKNKIKRLDESDLSGDDEEMKLDEKAVSNNSDEEDANSDEEKAESDAENANSDIEQDVEDKASESDEDEQREEKGQSDESDAGSEAEMETDQSDDNMAEESDNDGNIDKFVKLSPAKLDDKQIKNPALTFAQLGKNRKPEIKKASKPKDMHKNKNLKEKLQSRKFKKESHEEVKDTKIADPFFITSTGENYMSVAEPRQPDEVKEIHKQGNRRERRSAMFGHAPKVKPRQDFRENNFNRESDSNRFRNKFNQSDEGSYNNNSRGNDGFRNKNDSKFSGKNDKFRGRNDNQFEGRNNQFKGRSDKAVEGRNDKFTGRNDSKFKGRNNEAVEPKLEKLHPSWEAKKKQSGILPFQGKKIVFDEG